MSWTIITDQEERFDYAALLKDKTLYDLRVRVHDEPISIGDLYAAQVERYHPNLKAYSLILPDGVFAHLPQRGKASYQAGDLIPIQIRRLAEDGKDTLVTDQVKTDLFTQNMSEPQKLQSAPDLAIQLIQSYPDLQIKVDKTDDFDHYDLWSEIEKIKSNPIDLGNGISIHIDQTTALTAIDVNSTGQVSATKANILATAEISRQIRIRNLSGIIMIDFINMTEAADKDGVRAKLKKLTQDDPCPWQIYDFTALNLLEVSRKRIGSPLSVILG